MASNPTSSKSNFQGWVIGDRDHLTWSFDSFDPGHVFDVIFLQYLKKTLKLSLKKQKKYFL